MANEKSNPDPPEPAAPLLPPCCLSCGGAPRWESIADQWGERWLAVCECGRIEAFFPDRRQINGPPDPLTLFLQGHRAARRQASPAWVRLFLNSLQGEQPTHWRHSCEPCEACAARTVFGLLAWPRATTAGLCTVCLNCGYTVSCYSDPARGTSEPPLVGSVWAPACPAVKRLRECIRASRHPADDGGNEVAA
jgi:hypothetical protein